MLSLFTFLIDFLEILLSECCQYSTDLIANSSAADEPDLRLPVVVNLEVDWNSKKHSNLVPMIPGAGITFVVVKGNKGTQSLEMLRSLFTTWPVLLLILMLSFIAGIIAWFLVGHFVILSRNIINKQQIDYNIFTDA